MNAVGSRRTSLNDCRIVEKMSRGAEDHITWNERDALLDRSRGSEPAELVIFLRDKAGIYFHLEDGHQARSDELVELVIREQGLPLEAKEVFSLWFVSSILELRLKSHHQPFQIINHWDQLCTLYTDAKLNDIRDSEPVLMLQRDVFYPREQELFVTNEQILCLLYHEAKFNVIEGRYVLYIEDYHRLAGLQALIHLGNFTEEMRSQADYQANIVQFYPEHMYTKERFLFFGKAKSHIKEGEELFMEAHRKVSEEYADVDVDKSLAILYRKYLEVCWSYPFYGSAFFTGQIETPSSRLKKLILPPPDTEVWVAINTDCVTVINRSRCELLLSIPFSQLSWEYKDPDFDGDNDPPPCLFLQFLVDQTRDGVGGGDAETGAVGTDSSVTKLLKVYSREAKLMDALIETCVRKKLQHLQTSPGVDFIDGGFFDNANRKILNKLDQLCLSTYSRDGENLD